MLDLDLSGLDGKEVRLSVEEDTHLVVLFFFWCVFFLFVSQLKVVGSIGPGDQGWFAADFREAGLIYVYWGEGGLGGGLVLGGYFGGMV